MRQRKIVLVDAKFVNEVNSACSAVFPNTKDANFSAPMYSQDGKTVLFYACNWDMAPDEETKLLAALDVYFRQGTVRYYYAKDKAFEVVKVENALIVKDPQK